MSETPEVQAIGTLYQRGKVWRWKVKVPSELGRLPKYLNDKGETKQNAADVNLKTEDKTEARAKALALAAEWSTKFTAELRTLEVQSPQNIPPALVEAIAQRIRSAVLAEDERVRADPVALAAWLLPWWQAQEVARKGAHEREHPERRYSPRSMPDELTPEGVDELKHRPTYLGMPQSLMELLKERHKANAQSARKVMAIGSLAPFVMLADREAMALGVNLGADGWLPELGPLSPIHEACKRAYLQALDDLAQRDDGVMVDTPVVPSVPAKEAPKAKAAKHTLRDVFDKWKVSGDNPTPATIRKKQSSVKHFETLIKNAPIESLTKAMGVDFAAALLDTCKMQKTAKDHLDGVKSLLNFAVDKLGWLSVNEWAAQSIQVKQRNQRKPWPSEDLRKLVDSPLFKAYALPSTPSAGGAAAYWVPLLGLYTGARQSELCQLRIEDLQDTPEGFVMYVLRDGAGDEDGTTTTTKTDASNRRLPVHSDLIALGLKDYWRDMKDAGHKVLFPDIKRAPDRTAGEYFSDWFLIYRKQQGLVRRWVDFHGFRHTASTRLTDAGVADSVADYLTGHSGGGRGSARKYKAMQEIAPALEKLKYPELDLPRVYRKG
jgi:integrase